MAQETVNSNALSLVGVLANVDAGDADCAQARLATLTPLASMPRAPAKDNARQRISL